MGSIVCSNRLECTEALNQPKAPVMTDSPRQVLIFGQGARLAGEDGDRDVLVEAADEVVGVVDDAGHRPHGDGQGLSQAPWA
jgi:hypothetical protein